jgi:hypothetical protein
VTRTVPATFVCPGYNAGDKETNCGGDAMLLILVWAMRASTVLLGIGLLIVGLNDGRDGLVISAAILLGAAAIAAGNSK